MLCFGSTKFGQLGLGGIEEDQKVLPTENKFFEKHAAVKQVALGLEHTLFLLDDGTVYSCGNNDFEQLGHDGPRKRPEKITSLDAQFIVQVACGRMFSLALDKTGRLICWGSLNGQRDDDGYFFSKPTPIRLQTESSIVQIACGYNFFLILTDDGNVFVMGMNEFGQLGLGNQTPINHLVHLKSIQGIPITQIACGGYHSLILTVSGNIFAFGKNEFGQLGFGDIEKRTFPTHVKSLNQLKACFIACGEDFSSVLTIDGGVFTFGAGMYGQLGHDGNSHEYLPRKVLDLMGTEVTQIACGRCHMLVYQAPTNRLYSYGLNGNGQLGIGLSNGNKSNMTIVKCELANVKYNGNDKATSLKNLNLYSIFAGGDQSFLLCTHVNKHIDAVDFRHMINKNRIRTLNIIEDLEKFNKSLQLTNSPSSNVVMTAPLIKDLQMVLASAACINASFLDNDKHYGTSSRYPGVDPKRVSQIQKWLLKANDQNLKEMMIMQLTSLFNALPENPPSIEALRLYIITPYLIEFEEDKLPLQSGVHLLLYAYAQSVNRLRKESAGRVLDYWFAWSGVRFFRKLVLAYKNFVVFIINQPASTVASEKLIKQNLLESSMKFLQKLNKINLEFKEIVPFNTFYITELIDKIDIKQDYFEWMRRKNLRYPYQVFNMMDLTENRVLFCDYPFVFDGGAKTLLLQTDANFRKHMALQEAWTQNISSIFLPTIDPVNPYLTLFIRRTHIVQDALNQLSKQKRDDLKKPLKVMFINEDAIDAGGVTKEFFMLLLREILDLKYGMFNYYEETHTIWFNDQTLEGSEMYHLIGELCGLAIYNATIIDLPFPLALYKKLLKEKPNLQDMYTLSPSVGKSLDSLLKYEGDDFQDVFNLTFEITRQQFDETINVELIPGGSNIPVTKENCAQYVNAYVDYIFNKSVEQPFNAFSEGFHHVCGSKVLELFHPSELMAMVIGNQDYDFEEFEKMPSTKETIQLIIR